ncbi:hypothetical protein T265_10314 [Opisthorchis viverrini]|uniref:Tc1-like transposase DDE domain-containing protein n=1 Tax=Opisthorchis viverrini TaxID=6198 RepID=A0A074Z6Z2_OPIVI|nr:hypothetical protein T265_10314 [Opisthorchis viverrini]KER21342.1 hypothetical protein T265_10314 [Opisthorchis viverrini]
MDRLVARYATRSQHKWGMNCSDSEEDEFRTANHVEELFTQPRANDASPNGDGTFDRPLIQVPLRIRDSYLHMLQKHVIPQLKQHKKSPTVFQQDGAPPHYSNQVITYLQEQFSGERVIARRFPNIWPAMSPDLTPLDYWFWGMIKARVYHENKPKNLAELGVCTHSYARAEHHTLVVRQGICRTEYENTIPYL